MYLQGPQVNLNTGEPIDDRAGNPLVFTVEFGSNIQAMLRRTVGARPSKFRPDPNESGDFSHGNDFPFFRLGEMYLIRAEAAFNLGNTGQALC